MVFPNEHFVRSRRFAWGESAACNTATYVTESRVQDMFPQLIWRMVSEGHFWRRYSLSAKPGKILQDCVRSSHENESSYERIKGRVSVFSGLFPPLHKRPLRPYVLTAKFASNDKAAGLPWRRNNHRPRFMRWLSSTIIFGLFSPDHQNMGFFQHKATVLGSGNKYL